MPAPDSFDGFFLRTASFDIPAERKSAFALEMDDVRVMLRDSSRRSLALVDELGKGTSARCARTDDGRTRFFILPTESYSSLI